ncbi:MAG: hypothetical protein E6Q97_08990 [Desulfurellales bacterium]|nr:MAG: hypothetical protein E6Q97_08990 [Desulfurellales bacterium]
MSDDTAESDAPNTDDPNTGNPGKPKKVYKYPPRNFLIEKELRKKTSEEVAAEVQQVDEILENIATGKEKAHKRYRKLTAEQFDKIKADMQLLLFKGGQLPAKIIAAISVRYRISTKLATRIMDHVRDDAQRNSGYLRVQVQQIVQKLLLEVCIDRNATLQDKMRAASELGRMFDLRVPNEDSQESENAAVEGLMKRMATFDEKELAALQEQIAKGDISVEELYDPEKEGKELAKQKRRKRQWNKQMLQGRQGRPR